MICFLKKNGKYILLLSLLFMGCGSDLHTKKIAKEKLRYQSVEVINGVFDLTYVENHAIAFGFMKQINKKYRLSIIVFMAGSISFLLLLLIWKLREHRLLLLVSLILILAGAYGNIIDRLLHGFVTDFFHVYYESKFNFPVFNVADVLINIGILSLLFQIKYFDKAVQSLFPLNKKA